MLYSIKNSSLLAAISLDLLPYRIVHKPAFVRLLLHYFVVINVHPKGKSFLASTAFVRIHFSYSVLVFDFLCHVVVIWLV